MKVVEQQVALSDHLNAARSLIVGSGNRDAILHLVAGIATLLEAFDGLVSAHADQAPLRLAAGKNDLARLVADLALQMADELDSLALDLIVGPKNLVFPDHQATLDLFAGEIAKIAADPAADPDLLRAARLTRARLSWVVAHLGRLPGVLTNRDMAKKALAGVDPRQFVAPLEVSFPALLHEIRLSSPIFRHALRLGLALGVGYALILFIPGLRHGNWILLTIAVIMRASYSVTRQRRNQRLIGSLVGCVIAGGLLWTGSPLLLFAVQLRRHRHRPRFRPRRLSRDLDRRDRHGAAGPASHRPGRSGAGVRAHDRHSDRRGRRLSGQWHSAAMGAAWRPRHRDELSGPDLALRPAFIALERRRSRNTGWRAKA